MLRDWFGLSLSSLGIFKLTLKKLRKPLKTPWKDLEFLGQKRVGTLDIASSTNSKCSLNWKFRHPEWKSFLKENSTRHIFFKFSPCFSVKFAHFGEHFSPKTPMQSVYVCLLLDLLISLYFNRKFTRKLHCLHQIICEVWWFSKWTFKNWWLPVN